MIDKYEYITERSIDSGFNGIKLAVYGSEGSIPHFHFYKELDINKGIPHSAINGGGCICIEEPYYFLHGKHKEKLTSKEMKGLFEFLNKDIINKETNKLISEWQEIILLWNLNNPDNRVSINSEIPNYKYDMDSINKKKIVSSYYDDIFSLDNLFDDYEDN